MTMGVDRPPKGFRQITLPSTLSGSLVSGETPVCQGPRHCVQSDAVEVSGVTASENATINQPKCRVIAKPFPSMRSFSFQAKGGFPPSLNAFSFFDHNPLRFHLESRQRTRCGQYDLGAEH